MVPGRKRFPEIWPQASYRLKPAETWVRAKVPTTPAGPNYAAHNIPHTQRRGRTHHADLRRVSFSCPLDRTLLYYGSVVLYFSSINHPINRRFKTQPIIWI